MRRTPLFTLILSIASLLALIVVLAVKWGEVTPSKEAERISVRELTSAPQGSLLVDGVLQLSYASPYTRTYSVLGKPQVEELRVVPFTASDWQPSAPITALAIIRGDGLSSAFSGPAVNLGLAGAVALAPGLVLAPDAALLEMVPAEPPAWWYVLFGAAMLIFFALGVRGILKRIRG